MISGSGSAKYLYSPRPKPCRAMTIVERKRSLSPYIAATRRQASGGRSLGATAEPKASRSRFERRPVERIDCGLDTQALIRPAVAGPPGSSPRAGEGSRSLSRLRETAGVRASSRSAITRPRGREACACARRPSDSPTGRRRCARPDGRESRPPADWRRRPAPPRAPPSAGRPRARSPRSSPSCPAGWRGAPANLLLEGGAADVERQIEILSGRLDETDDPSDGAFEIGVASDQFGARKTILQLARQRLRIVAEQDGADALIRRGDEHAAERGLADREPDFRALAAATRRGRGHAEARGRSCVEAARRVETRVVDRLGDSPGFAQAVGRAPRPHLGGIGLRGYARDFS